MIYKRFASILLILALAFPSLAAQTAPAATLVVDTASDVRDAGECNTITPASLPGPDGLTSLREAICAANNHPGADLINFDIPGAGAHTIQPAALSPLPALSGGGTTIDGYSQPGAAPTTGDTPATILIEINGANITANNGFNITSANNSIRGLAINRFGYAGVAIGGSAAFDNVIQGNYIGTDSVGMLDWGNGASGVFIGLGASNNLVVQNVLSANWEGIAIHGVDTHENQVRDNYIGTSSSGMAALGNAFYGVRVYGGAHNNVVGSGNVISGNGKNGVHLAGEGTNENLVYGNRIGLTRTGASPLGNFENGVTITRGAQNNTIGGSALYQRNIISGNLESGVVISGTTTLSNTLYGNYIGTGLAGTAAFPNNYGVFILLASHNQVGGAGPGQGNLISGNQGPGVFLINPGTAGNVIAGNRIGTDESGAVALGNGGGGINIWQEASGNTVGPGNVISANDEDGISLGVAVTGTHIFSNVIGLSADGTAPLGNNNAGIALSGAIDNIIGGDTPTLRNLISANHLSGIAIEHGSRNTIIGNYIGTDVTGAVALSNSAEGIHISGWSQANRIGSPAPGERNLISGNTASGILLSGADTAGTVIVNNDIGTDASGSTALGNGGSGILIELGSHHNQIGGATPEERNVIAANTRNGIVIEASRDNRVSGNFIGTNAAGDAPLGNTYGLVIGSGAQNNTIGGDAPGEGNLIAANQRDGIYLANVDTTNNQISGNRLGTDLSGTLDLGNLSDGIEIDMGAHNNLIGPWNIMAYNAGSGICVDGAEPISNTFTRNSIFTNTHLGIELTPGAHGDIQPPEILTQTLANALTGVTCPGCMVEFFSNQTDDGEGEQYIGSAPADEEGNFSFTLPAFTSPYLTATATDPERGTSAFSAVFTRLNRESIFLPFIRK